MTPHFEASVDDDEPAAGLDERPVGIGLEQVRAGEPGAPIHPVDADEDEVDVDGPQGCHRERADERVGRRPDAAGQDDRLVRAAGLVEHVADADRVGHDGQAGDVGQPLRERERRRPGRDGDRHAGLDQRDGGVRDRVLLALLERRLQREARFEQGGVGDRCRAAVDLLEKAALVEDLEVAPDRHVRDAELAHQVGDAHGAVLADAVEDQGLTLPGEHQAATAPCHVDASARTSTAPFVRRQHCRVNARKSTRSNTQDHQ